MDFKYMSMQFNSAKANEEINRQVYFNVLENAIEQRNEKVKELKKRVDDLEKELYDYKENILLERYALPHRLLENKTFMEIHDMPTYEYLYDRNEEYKELTNYIKDRINFYINDTEWLEKLNKAFKTELTDKVIFADNQTIVELKKILNKIDE